VREGFYKIAKNKNVVMYLYVADKAGKLLGVIDIKQLLKAKASAKLESIMVKDFTCLSPESSLKEAAAMFSRYHFRAIPVTDKDDKLLGVLPYRDVMELKHRFID